MANSSRDNYGEDVKEQLVIVMANLSSLVSKLGDQAALQYLSHFALITRKLEELCEDVE